MPSPESIWSNLAAWTGPERLYELMQRCRDGRLTQTEDGEFTTQLFRVVWMQFQQHRLSDKLRQVRADPEGVAQEAVMHLRRKSRKGLHLKAEGWKPMMTVMNLAVFRFTMTEILRANRLHHREATSTDYHNERSVAGDESGMDSGQGPGESRSIEGLSDAIDAAEDMVIGDIVCSAREQRHVEKLFKVVKNQILKKQTPLPHALLPVELKEVSCELHGLVVSRVLRVIRDFCGS